MKRSRTVYLLLALSFLTIVIPAQQIDWDDVVFTSIARARSGCILTSGYDATKHDFLLKDCRITQDLVFPAPGHVRGIDFTNDRDGWLLFGSGPVPFTDGKTGRAPRVGNEDWLFAAVSFYDEVNGCAITHDGDIACTHDRGKTWSPTHPVGIVDGFEIAFSSRNVVWALANSKGVAGGDCRAIIRSDDAGTHWSRITNLKGCDLYLAGFLDDFHAWALRANNQLLFTKDGGKSWRPISIVPSKPDDLYFVTQSTGWFIDDGRFYGTIDGGYSWKKLWAAPPSTYVNPRGLLFIDEVNGWLMTLDKLYRTGDGGKSWIRVVPS